MLATEKAGHDQFTRPWRTQLVLTQVTYPGYKRAFRVVPRDTGEDMMTLKPAELPSFALEYGPGTRCYAMVNVGARNSWEMTATAWENRMTIILQTVVTGDGSNDRIFFVPGLPQDCNRVTVPFNLLPELIAKAVPGWTGHAYIMVRPDGTIDHIASFEHPDFPEPPRSTLVPHPYRGSQDSLVVAVNREFEQAGGVWAALASSPLDLRRVTREAEAVCREHHTSSLQELIKEMTGYVRLACQAFYAEGVEAGRQMGAESSGKPGGQS